MGCTELENVHYLGTNYSPNFLIYLIITGLSQNINVYYSNTFNKYTLYKLYIAINSLNICSFK